METLKKTTVGYGSKSNGSRLQGLTSKLSVLVLFLLAILGHPRASSLSKGKNKNYSARSLGK
jgi:hypothetical protein